MQCMPEQGHGELVRQLTGDQPPQHGHQSRIGRKGGRDKEPEGQAGRWGYALTCNGLAMVMTERPGFQPKPFTTYASNRLR